MTINYITKLLKGANLAMMREYVTPDFDVTIYEIEDVITLSINGSDPDGGDSGDWWWE